MIVDLYPKADTLGDLDDFTATDTDSDGHESCRSSRLRVKK